jgi:hypothetical protein
MRQVTAILMSGLLGGSVWAVSLRPYHSGMVQVDRIVAASSEQTAPAVLQILRDIVVGRTSDISPALLTAAALKTVDISLLRAPEVRAYAVEKIAAVGSDDSIAWLKALRVEDLPGDRSYTVYGAVQVAYRRTLLSREPDPNAQRAFLEDLLQRRSDPWASDRIFSWALSELCNRGSVGSMPIIEQALGKQGDPPALNKIRECEAMMTIVNSNPDRIQAIGSALDRLVQAHTGTDLDTRLVIWATDQLSRDKSKEAQAALARFVTNAAGLQGDSDSPGTGALKALAQSYRGNARP